MSPNNDNFYMSFVSLNFISLFLLQITCFPSLDLVKVFLQPSKNTKCLTMEHISGHCAQFSKILASFGSVTV